MYTISPASSACSQAWPDHPPAIAWDGLLSRFAHLFTRPSAALFTILVGAWVLCPGHRTVTRMISIGDPDGEHAHDAYHRFLRVGAWTMARLWCRLLGLLLVHLALGERLMLDLDDALFHKCGRKVNGAGSFRDAIRSRGQHTVFAHGLNLVVLTLLVRPPWGGSRVGIPAPGHMGRHVVRPMSERRSAAARRLPPSSRRRPAELGRPPTYNWPVRPLSSMDGAHGFGPWRGDR